MDESAAALADPPPPSSAPGGEPSSDGASSEADAATSAHAATSADAVDRTPRSAPTLEAALGVSPASALDIAKTLRRGLTTYVLYAVDDAAVARARLLGRPGGEQRVADVDDALDTCEDEHEESTQLDCMLPLTPEPALAFARVGHAESVWVAAVTHDATTGAWTRRARRSLTILSSAELSDDDEVDTASSDEVKLRARDLDGDGELELIVRFPVGRVVDPMSLVEGSLVYLLAHDLHAQFRMTASFERQDVDVAGTSETCEGGWRIDGAAAYGLTARTRCVERFEDELGDPRPARRTRRSEVCPYDPAGDRWRCAEGVAEHLFGRSGGAFAAERWEQLESLRRGP